MRADFGQPGETSNPTPVEMLQQQQTLQGEFNRLQRRIAELEQLGLQRDLYERKLRESEERYRRITAAITDYIYTVRIENGRPVETRHGDACISVTGYSADEFARDPYLWIRMVPPEDQSLVKTQAEALLQNRNAEAVEHRLMRKDGRVRWVRNAPVCHFDANGRLTAYDGLIKDITEQKEAERALRASEERFRAIADYTCDWENWFDARGAPLWINPAVERWTGYTVAECLKLSAYPLTLVHEEDRPRMERIFHEAAAGSTGNDVIHRIRRKDGETAWMTLSWQPIYNNEGVCLGFRTSARDITERMRAQEERERLLREREETRAKLKTLHGLLPICAACKKIRNDTGYWEQIETYVRNHSEAEFSHGICPECMKKLYPEYVLPAEQASSIRGRRTSSHGGDPGSTRG